MNFFAKMNEQLQYTWNFQLSMQSLKNGAFHSHLLPLVHLQTGHHTTKKKKKQTNKKQQHGNTTWRRSCMLDLKMKENKRVLLENWRSAKHEEWWIYPLSLSLGKFQPYYSISYWPNLPLFLVEVGYRS